MPPASQWLFGPFRLDSRNGCLWHGAESVPLPPTAFALLHYLVTHAGQLVTKDELFAAIWSETVVSEAVLKVRMGEVRKALGETARAPQCIATVHRRGYRFVAPVTRLEVSPRTVHKHLGSAYEKLGAHDRLAAVRRAEALGLLRDPRCCPESERTVQLTIRW